MRQDIGPIDDPALVEREDDEDFVANLADNVAPLTELVGLPLAPGNKVACPFHEDAEPSCTIYPDHFHCFGCGDTWQPSRLADAGRGHDRGRGRHHHQGLALDTGSRATKRQRYCREAGLYQIDLDLGTAAVRIDGRALSRRNPRHIDVTRLPEDIHRSLRFHPNCVFGPGIHLPCLIALMRDPLTDEPVGIQRIALRHRNGRIEKIERRMLGRAGVVKIWPAGPQLVVGEGLETVLAAATRIPYAGASLTPAWAALSSQKLGALPVVAGR